MPSGFINPHQILKDHLVLENTMNAADLGCGSGEWTIALAQILENGTVYAIDLLEEPLSVVRSKARNKGLKNIELIQGDVEKFLPRLRSDSLDIVLLTNIIFQAQNRVVIFNQTNRILKMGGQLLVIEWKEIAPIGPAQKIAPEEIKKIAITAGFTLTNEFSAGNFHYGLTFKKSNIISNHNYENQ